MICQPSSIFKHFGFFGILLVLFICTPSSVSAQTPTLIPTAAPTPFTQNSNSFGFFDKITRYFSKDYNIDPSNVNNRQAQTNYDQKDRDITSRAINESERAYEKGYYIKQVLDGDYDDRVLAYTCNNTCYAIDSEPENCNEVKISTVAYYFYTQNIRILYEKDNKTTPIAYNLSAFRGTYNLINDGSCYLHLYDGLYIVPQGSVDSQANTANISSQQLNNSLKTPVYQSWETDHPEQTGLWGWILNLLGLKIDENKRQEKFMLSQFVPDKTNDQSNDNDTMRTQFANYMYPYSWQTSPPERGTSSNGSGGHSMGLSQYGAQGRALSGQKYTEILTAYYGTNTTLKKIDTSNAKIEITPGNEILDFETNYMLGIAEMPDGWEMEALKAQAVAARTYAYVYTNSFSKPICIDTHCQVYNPQHVTLAPRWKKAVEATAGQILVDSTTNLPFLTMYSAWNGGQSIAYDDSGHSTVSVYDKDYEKKAGAPY